VEQMFEDATESFSGNDLNEPSQDGMVVPAGGFVISPDAILRHGLEFLRALYESRQDLEDRQSSVSTEEPMAFAQGGVIPLAGGGKIAVGPGGGLDDLIPTSINGRRAAALSDGEFVIPADVVSMMGDGSSNAGSRRLYDLVRQVRDNKTGTTRQAGPLPVGEILKRSVGR
jgi:hypothetical protein